MSGLLKILKAIEYNKGANFNSDSLSVMKEAFFNFALLLYILGQQLRSCRDSFYPNNTVSGQASLNGVSGQASLDRLSELRANALHY